MQRKENKDICFVLNHKTYNLPSTRLERFLDDFNKTYEPAVFWTKEKKNNIVDKENTIKLMNAFFEYREKHSEFNLDSYEKICQHLNFKWHFCSLDALHQLILKITDVLNNVLNNKNESTNEIKFRVGGEEKYIMSKERIMSYIADFEKVNKEIFCWACEFPTNKNYDATIKCKMGEFFRARYEIKNFTSDTFRSISDCTIYSKKALQALIDYLKSLIN